MRFCGEKRRKTNQMQKSIQSFYTNTCIVKVEVMAKKKQKKLTSKGNGAKERRKRDQRVGELKKEEEKNRNENITGTHRTRYRCLFVTSI